MWILKPEAALSVSLRNAIEQLYRVFAAYPAPAEPLSASHLRDPAAIKKRLLSAPLRELLEDQLSSYPAQAMTTVDGVDTYRHFFPRIFELAAQGAKTHGFDPWLIASKVVYGGFQSWPDAERLAVAGAFLEAWKWALTFDVEDSRAAQWLEGVARTGTVTDALHAWRCSPSGAAVAHVGVFVWDFREQLKDGGVIGGHCTWDEVLLAKRQEITAWLRSQDTWDWMNEADLAYHSYAWGFREKAYAILRPGTKP